MPERVSSLEELGISARWQVEGPHNVFVNYRLTAEAGEVQASSGWHRLSSETESLPYGIGCNWRQERHREMVADFCVGKAP
jgi:hypothetical protein